jgi:hypothetical protein
MAAKLVLSKGNRIDDWPEIVAAARQDAGEWLAKLVPQNHDALAPTKNRREIKGSDFAEWLTKSIDSVVTVPAVVFKELKPATIAWKYPHQDLPDFFVWDPHRGGGTVKRSR